MSLSQRFAAASANQKLALVALLLGALALLGSPESGARVTIDVADLAWTAGGGAGRVSAPQLADWLISGRSDLRLLDLQPADGYARYHLPGAENVALAGLPALPLARDERVVVYADDAVTAAQAWVLLRARRHAAYLLGGGLAAWKEEVLFPRVPEAPSPGAAAAVLARSAEVSRFFGGQPRGAGAAASVEPAPAVPVVAAPAAPAAAAPKRKKEGC
jgi:rhodanese-related sulfurtransferase